MRTNFFKENAFLSNINKYKYVILITLLLFVGPFFWLAPGEMNLGGDDNLLFFYNPTAYLKNSVIYDVVIEGKGKVEPHYYYLSYVGFLAILKYFISSTALISIINGLKLAGGFLSIFFIVYELLKGSNQTNNRKTIYTSAILAGIFYVVSFSSINMTFFWNTALTSHNQIFLNPLIFYLLLKFFLTSKYKYLWISLLVSFIFAPNFGYTSAPAFFTFYPLAFLFLFFYIKIVKKGTIPWKKVFVGILLFLGIQSFHLVGQVANLFDKGSSLNISVFNNEQIEQGGVNYFYAIRGFGKATLNVLLPSEKQFLQWTSLLVPLIVIIGLMLDKKRRELLLIATFFVITLFLATANVTNIGFLLYKNLFYIPGFSMFRNFYTQWLFVFIFFYSLLFGFSINSILEKIRPYYAKIFSLFVFLILLITSFPLVSGELITKRIIRGSSNIKSTFIMDPQYEKTFKFIRSLPDDGKILVLPLNDYYFQVISGKNGGAYEGTSTMRHLSTKYSFVGYQHFGYIGHLPYAEDVMRYSREKNYNRLLRIFTVLNIRYILHNTDPMAYDSGSYGYVKTSMPKTQEEYKDFVAHFPFKIIYTNDPYKIYEIEPSLYNPTIFTPDAVYQNNKLSFDEDKLHSIFIEENICSMKEFKSLCMGEYKKPNVDFGFTMVKPTLYAITVRQHEKVNSMLLVMQHAFHNGWKLVSEEKYIAENTHVLVNGYANGWLITKKDIPDKEVYTLFIKLDPQKYFWYGLLISTISLFILFVLIIYSFIKRVLGIFLKGSDKSL